MYLYESFIYSFWTSGKLYCYRDLALGSAPWSRGRLEVPWCLSLASAKICSAFSLASTPQSCLGLVGQCSRLDLSLRLDTLFTFLYLPVASSCHLPQQMTVTRHHDVQTMAHANHVRALQLSRNHFTYFFSARNEHTVTAFVTSKNSPRMWPRSQYHPLKAAFRHPNVSLYWSHLRHWMPQPCLGSAGRHFSLMGQHISLCLSLCLEGFMYNVISAYR